MYDPEAFRRENARLRDEIETNRTPEDRSEADQIRAQRSEYYALPNNKKNELEEIEVFKAFVSVAQVGYDSGSGVNAQSPEPDIRCTINGECYYFELGEIIDQSVARCIAHTLRYDEPRGAAFVQDMPFAYIIKKKRTKIYRTHGAPFALLLYYRNQSPPFPSHFDDLLARSIADLEGLVTSGPFQYVWIFDFATRRVLWHSGAINTLPAHEESHQRSINANDGDKFDLSRMEEICCPECKRPLLAVPDPGNQTNYKFQGCGCEREEYTVPDCILFGARGAPAFFYRKRGG